MNSYQIHFFRAPEKGEIGPQSVIVEFACKNKTEANKTGRFHAKQNDLRFIEVIEPVIENVNQ